ncbi:MAG: glutamate--tRNA ligase [Bacteroidota bacterium]
MSEVVLRFAPSPTGPLHIGGVRTALFNYLYAKKHNGRFILRIEDTDRTRFVPGAEEYIIEALKWLGIEFTEGVHLDGPVGPYRQSDRNAAGLYRQYADQLVNDGHAYYAFDTSEELDAMRERLKAEGSSVQQYNALTRGSMRNSLSLPEDEVQRILASDTPYVIRMKMPEKESVTFYDHVRDDVVFDTEQLDDKILLKSDGMPTYHLANVVDDHSMGITHVIRGEEWLSSTPLHVLLYRGLGWEDSMPQFAHLPLILNPNGVGKMSKRQGDKLGFSVFPTTWEDPESGKASSGYREDGYLPEALLNFLALLGWNPGNDEEIMSAERLTELFDLPRIVSKGATFDIDKLKWFNQTYIKEKKPLDLLPLVRPLWEAAGYALPDDPDFETGVIEMLQERVTVLPDFVSSSAYFFAPPAEYDAKMSKKRWKDDSPELMQALLAAFKACDHWNSEALHGAFEQLIKEREIGAGRVLAPLRLALTGIPAGPGAFDIAALLGEEETVRRIERAIEQLG